MVIQLIIHFLWISKGSIFYSVFGLTESEKWKKVVKLRNFRENWEKNQSGACKGQKERNDVHRVVPWLGVMKIK